MDGYEILDNSGYMGDDTQLRNLVSKLHRMQNPLWFMTQLSHFSTVTLWGSMGGAVPPSRVLSGCKSTWQRCVKCGQVPPGKGLRADPLLLPGVGLSTRER